MTLSIERLPWYGQLAAFVAMALAGVGVFWYFYAQPAEADLTVRRQQLASLRTEIADGLTTARRLPEFRRDVGVLGMQLEASALEPLDLDGRALDDFCAERRDREAEHTQAAVVFPVGAHAPADAQASLRKAALGGCGGTCGRSTK